jgi:hypothetical protein
MSTLALRLVVDDSEAEDLRLKGGALMAAIEGAVGSLGTQLYDLVMSKLSGGVLKRGTGQLAAAVELEAAAFVGQVCSTVVGIDDSSPSYVVGFVNEYGGSGWYDIYPLETQLGFISDAGIGAGIKSPFSDRSLDAWKESRLPHTLAFVGSGGGMVFASHVWHPPAKERSYLRSSLAELEEQVYVQLQAAVDEVLAL